MAIVLWRALPVGAQEDLPADSLVADFLQRGAYSGWTPAQIFRHCERLDEVDERALELLLDSDLSPELTDELALNWMVVLKGGCQPPVVVDWLLDQVDAGVGQGRDPATMSTLWTALELASSPRVRDRVRGYVLDTSLPEPVRVWAGKSMFLGADTEGRREEFTAAFRSGRTPYPLAVQIGGLMARDDTDWTLREAARLVAEDPQLVDQSLFGQIVASSRRHATEAQRERLAQALETIAERPGLSSQRRDHLVLVARGLRRPGA